MYDNRRGGSVFGAFLLGGLVGAVLGLLFAPRSGRETRDIIAERAEDYWGQGVDMYNTGVEKAGEAVSVGKDKVAETSEQLRTKIDEARDRLQEQVAKSSEAARDKVGEAIPAVHGAVDRAADATKGAVEVAGGKTQDSLDFVAKKAKGDQPLAGGIDVPAVPEV